MNTQNQPFPSAPPPFIVFTIGSLSNNQFQPGMDPNARAPSREVFEIARDLPRQDLRMWYEACQPVCMNPMQAVSVPVNDPSFGTAMMQSQQFAFQQAPATMMRPQQFAPQIAPVNAQPGLSHPAMMQPQLVQAQAPHGALCGHEVPAMMPSQFTHQQSGFYTPIASYSQQSLQPIATGISAANGSVSFPPSIYVNPTPTVPTTVSPQYTQLPAQTQNHRRRENCHEQANTQVSPAQSHESMRQQSFCEPAQENTVINKADPARDEFQTNHEAMMQTQKEQQNSWIWFSHLCPRVIDVLEAIKNECNHQGEQDILKQWESELRLAFCHWTNKCKDPRLVLIITAFAEEHVQTVLREAQKQAGRVVELVEDCRDEIETWYEIRSERCIKFSAASHERINEDIIPAAWNLVKKVLEPMSKIRCRGQKENHELSLLKKAMVENYWFHAKDSDVRILHLSNDVASEMMRLIEYENGKSNRNRRMCKLLQCFRRKTIPWMQKKRWSPGDALGFSEEDLRKDQSNGLQNIRPVIAVLREFKLIQMSKDLPCRLHICDQSSSNDEDEDNTLRGHKVTRYRLKRVHSFGKESYDLDEHTFNFIKNNPGTVDLIRVCRDHRSTEKKAKKKRRHSAESGNYAELMEKQLKEMMHKNDNYFHGQLNFSDAKKRLSAPGVKDFTWLLREHNRGLVLTIRHCFYDFRDVRIEFDAASGNFLHEKQPFASFPSLAESLNGRQCLDVEKTIQGLLIYIRCKTEKKNQRLLQEMTRFVIAPTDPAKARIYRKIHRKDKSTKAGFWDAMGLKEHSVEQRLIKEKVWNKLDYQLQMDMCHFAVALPKADINPSCFESLQSKDKAESTPPFQLSQKPLAQSAPLPPFPSMLEVDEELAEIECESILRRHSHPEWLDNKSRHWSPRSGLKETTFGCAGL